jgi:hypothetical protein
VNNERRKGLQDAKALLEAVQKDLNDIQWDEFRDALQGAKDKVEEIKDEEQEAFDNLSEGLQQAERGQRMEEVIGILDDAESEISDTLEKIGEAAAIADKVGEDMGKIDEALE